MGRAATNGFKEETSSFTALFRGSRRMSGFKYQQLWLGMLRGVTSGCWENSCPLTWEV